MRWHRKWLVFFSLIMLTQLDGTPIWVESSVVQVIRPATQQCRQMKGSGIQVGAVALCVRETPEEIKAKVERVK